MKQTRSLAAALVALLVAYANPSRAERDALVFYLDHAYRPQTRLDRLPKRTQPIDGVLAMYALQNGAGCAGRDSVGLRCKLTEDLGLGVQCSPAHVALVRKTFHSPLPQMSGFAARLYASPQEAGNLEVICAQYPDSASRQRIWTTLRVEHTEDRLVVHARGSWVTPDASADFAYRTEYRLNGQLASVVSHVEVPVRPSSR